MIKKKNYYPLAVDSWDTSEISAINKVMKSGLYTMGNEVKKFEKEYAHYFKMKHAVMVNSGSSANFLSIFSLIISNKINFNYGDEVILPALAWSTTYSPFYFVKSKLKIVDININTLNVDLNLIKKAVTKKTKMIVAVSILGNPADLEDLRIFCKNRNIILFEDNCESLGAKLNGKFTGSFGLLSTCSFFFSHHISTIEGGMVLTNDSSLAKVIRSVRAHGWTRDIEQFNKKKIEYNFIYPGMNVRPTEINAAIGRVQIKKLKKMINIRRNNFLLYNKLFNSNKAFYIQKENGQTSSFSLTFVLRKNYKKYLEIIKKKLLQNKIEFRLITGGCFTKHPYSKFFDYKIHNNLKNTNYIHENGFFIGNHPIDLEKKLIKVKKILDEVINV
tara:strand:- start:292 stop:1455 length:1164 start_codon:yes stop_codon:yes gene_type:complete